ncbi:DDE superendonuclease family protein [Orientia tsutsugamushi str. UT76]|nr:DDE superendonuclease family protein [Orientia tsutsugamushi str. UT76]
MIDNTSFHKRPYLKTMIEKMCIYLEYLPPYSHDLNPIEKSGFKINQAE